MTNPESQLQKITALFHKPSGGGSTERHYSQSVNGRLHRHYPVNVKADQKKGFEKSLERDERPATTR
jgi:hypothetical protein